MKRFLYAAALVLAGFLFLPGTTLAAEDAAKPYLGKVLIDVSSKGEAWYVNPQTYMRVYLGRPDEALERFTARAIHVTFANISRLSETGGADSEASYAGQVAGYVLSPSDLPGAAWYVDPSTGTRKRLATAADAWEIMRTGTPVTGAALAAIAKEPTDPPAVTEATIQEVVSADTLRMTDGKTVKLLGIEVPSNPEIQDAARARIAQVVNGSKVTLEADVDRQDRDGNLLRYVSAGGVMLNYDLVRQGIAFHAIEAPNFKHAELLIVGAIDALAQKRGVYGGRYLAASAD
jgi:endonuclease YncB( thermonuclease family)